jgi:uncharacterized membrane protein (TIGR02234 family)
VTAARRELAAVLVLAAAGSVAALAAAAGHWLIVTAPRRPPLPDVTLALTGRSVEPLVPALGLVGLAGLVALVATRGWGRLAVGGLLTAAGAVVAVRALARLAGPDPAAARALVVDAGRAGAVAPGTAVTATPVRGWPLLAALGGLALLAAGVGVLLRSRRWPAMSARYDRPTGNAPAAAPPAPRVPPERVGPQRPDAVWDALDRGHDPTAT